MTDSNLESRFNAAMSRVNAKRAEQKRAEMDARNLQESQRRSEEQMLEASKAKAVPFSRNRLERLFHQLQVLGDRRTAYQSAGDSICDETQKNWGVIGRKLLWEGSHVAGVIRYNFDTLTAEVFAAGKSAGDLYFEHESVSVDSFNEEVMLAWFEEHLMEAIEKLFSSGDVPLR